MVTACATADGRKDGGLVPFAPAGVTEGGTSEGRRFALVVGIDTFDDERFRPLRFATADATAMGNALADFHHVTVLTSADETSRTSILAAMADIRRRATRPSDTVVLYVSSHGSLTRRPGGRLERVVVARDSRMDLLGDTGILVERLLTWSRQLRSRRVAIVLAMCHGGRGKSHIDDALARELATYKSPVAIAPLRDVSRASAVLTASAFEEVARESEQLGHDIYTAFLLEGIAAGDRNGDGAVTVSEAHDYARGRTYAYTEGAQRPTAEWFVVGTDPIVLRGNPARGKPVVFSYSEAAEGLDVRVDGTTKGSLPGGVVLEPGTSEITLVERKTGEVRYTGSIELRQGERRNLEQLIARRRPFYLGLGLGGAVALDRDLRGDLLPPTGSVVLRGGARGWLARRLLVEASLSVARGSGRENAFGQSLEVDLRRYDFQLAAAWAAVDQTTVDLLVGPYGGFALASREVRTASFVGDERLGGWTFGGLIDVGTILGPIRLAARLQTGALLARFDDELEMTPEATIQLWTSFRF